MKTAVTIAGVTWKNPVTVASGTFGSGAEYGELVDLNQLGAVTTKGVANIPWQGNPTLSLSSMSWTKHPPERATEIPPMCC